MAKYSKNNIETVKQVLKFKCYDCGAKFAKYPQLVKHTETIHINNIPEGTSVDKYLFDSRNPKAVHICVICKKNPTVWNQTKLKYERFCSIECKTKAGDLARKNMVKIYKKTTLLNDPEHQAKMLANRSISGVYKFNSDGGEIGYTGSYELDFLMLLDNELKFTSVEIVSSPTNFEIYYYHENVKRFYIPDFYLPEYNLMIEIKDGSKYPIESKEKSKLKDAAVIKAKKCNYIKIVGKEYSDFLELINTLDKKKMSDNGKTDFIYIIPVEK